MTRKVSIDAHGTFTVSDDPRGVLAVALVIATAPQNVPLIDKELAPDGGGLHVQSFGSIDRVESRDALPEPYNEDPSLDPETQELWRLYRERDRTYGATAQMMISGDELRELVSQAVALRAQWRASSES
jgi:hypothetical protein